MKFNINNYIQCKLTNEGFSVYNERKNKYGANETLEESIVWLNKYHAGDKNGWFRFQMWELMSIFGSKIYMGGPNLFDLEIIIEEKED